MSGHPSPLPQYLNPTSVSTPVFLDHHGAKVGLCARSDSSLPVLLRLSCRQREPLLTVKRRQPIQDPSYDSVNVKPVLGVRTRIQNVVSLSTTLKEGSNHRSDLSLSYCLSLLPRMCTSSRLTRVYERQGFTQKRCKESQISPRLSHRKKHYRGGLIFHSIEIKYVPTCKSKIENPKSHTEISD